MFLQLQQHFCTAGIDQSFHASHEEISLITALFVGPEVSGEQSDNVTSKVGAQSGPPVDTEVFSQINKTTQGSTMFVSFSSFKFQCMLIQLAGPETSLLGGHTECTLSMYAVVVQYFCRPQLTVFLT